MNLDDLFDKHICDDGVIFTSRTSRNTVPLGLKETLPTFKQYYQMVKSFNWKEKKMVLLF